MPNRNTIKSSGVNERSANEMNVKAEGDIEIYGRRQQVLEALEQRRRGTPIQRQAANPNAVKPARRKARGVGVCGNISDAWHCEDPVRTNHCNYGIFSF